MNADDALERAMWDTFWLPDDARAVSREEVLYLQCPRDIPGLNSVLRVRADERRLASLVAEVASAHRGVCSRWCVKPRDGGPALTRVLAAAGYALTIRHHAYSLDVDVSRPVVPASIVVRRVKTMAQLDDALAVKHRAFEMRSHTTPAERQRFFADCTGSGARAVRFVAYDRQTGAPISAGGLTVHRALNLGFLWAGATLAEARGRGAYTAIMSARIAFAREVGLRWVGLFARHETSAPIVAKQGFTRHGPMDFWVRPPASH